MRDDDAPMFDDTFQPREDTAMMTPVATALLFRRGIGCTEIAWVHAYEEVRMVVELYPSVTRPDGVEMLGYVGERHVGARASVADIFSATVGRLEAEGWTRRPTDVMAGEPWDTPSVLDQPPTF